MAALAYQPVRSAETSEVSFRQVSLVRPWLGSGLGLGLGLGMGLGLGLGLGLA